MSALVDFAAEAERPAEAAAEIAALNRSLAAHATIPPEVAGPVRELAGGLARSDVVRWARVDPYPALLVHRAALEALAAVEAAGDPEARDRLRVALAALEHALASIAEREPVGDDRPAEELARWLAATLEVPQRELAELLGVDLRRLQRWLSERGPGRPEGEDARRVRAVARIVAQLRHALTGVGVVDWFRRPHPDLGGRAPLDVLDDPMSLPELVELAGALRATVAT